MLNKKPHNKSRKPIHKHSLWYTKKGHTFMLSNTFRLLILPLTLDSEMAKLDSWLDCGNQNSSRNLLTLQPVG